MPFARLHYSSKATGYVQTGSSSGEPHAPAFFQWDIFGSMAKDLIFPGGAATREGGGLDPVSDLSPRNLMDYSFKAQIPAVVAPTGGISSPAPGTNSSEATKTESTEAEPSETKPKSKPKSTAATARNNHANAPDARGAYGAVAVKRTTTRQRF